jgi:NAD(P)H dehydrogenase (quinone)
MDKTKILVAFYSRNGMTESLAKAVGEGAEAAGAEVRLRRARDIVGPEIMAKAPGWAENAARMNAEYPAPTEEDAEWADGIVFGTPTRFDNVSAELKAYVDSLGGIWFQGKLNGKAGGAFTSTSSLHGGKETTMRRSGNRDRTPRENRDACIAGTPRPGKSCDRCRTWPNTFDRK